MVPGAGHGRPDRAAPWRAAARAQVRRRGACPGRPAPLGRLGCPDVRALRPNRTSADNQSPAWRPRRPAGRRRAVSVSRGHARAPRREFVAPRRRQRLVVGLGAGPLWGWAPSSPSSAPSWGRPTARWPATGTSTSSALSAAQRGGDLPLGEQLGDLGDHLGLGLGAGDAQVAGQVLAPAGSTSMSSIGASGISACTARRVGQADGVGGRDHDAGPASSKQVRDLAEAAHQLGLGGVDPQVVVDAQQHVLAVEHVDVAARRRTAPSPARARSGACRCRPCPRT